MLKNKNYYCDNSREHFLNALKAIELLGIKPTKQTEEADCKILYDCKKLLNSRLAEIFKENANA